MAPGSRRVSVAGSRSPGNRLVRQRFAAAPRQDAARARHLEPAARRERRRAAGPVTSRDASPRIVSCVCSPRPGGVAPATSCVGLWLSAIETSVHSLFKSSTRETPPTAGLLNLCSREYACLAGSTVPPGGDLDRAGRQFRDLLRARHPRRALPVRLARRDRAVRLRPAARTHRHGVARLLSRTSARASCTVTASTARTSRPPGHRFNPHKIVIDPYAKAIGRPVRWDDSMFGYRIGDPRGRPVVRHARQRRLRAAGRGDRSRRSPGATTGRRARRGTRRSSTRCTSRASRKLHPGIPEALRGTYAALTTEPAHRAPAAARRHGGRADAGASPRLRPAPRRARPVELLGLQHAVVLRARTSATRASSARRRVGARVQADGEGAAQRRPRGHPRRRLQPHRRGQPPRADAVAARHRQRDLLPARARGQALLPRLHRLRQHAEHAEPAGAAADHGQPALLGARDARRRLPLRPGERAGARAVRSRPARRVLRHHPPGPGASRR